MGLVLSWEKKMESYLPRGQASQGGCAMRHWGSVTKLLSNECVWRQSECHTITLLKGSWKSAQDCCHPRIRWTEMFQEYLLRKSMRAGCRSGNLYFSVREFTDIQGISGRRPRLNAAHGVEKVRSGRTIFMESSDIAHMAKASATMNRSTVLWDSPQMLPTVSSSATQSSSNLSSSVSSVLDLLPAFL